MALVQKKRHAVRIALELCQEANVVVVGLTFDGVASNLHMAKVLGCNFSNPNNITSVFRNAGHIVHVLPDACHNLKLIRNSFQFFGTLTDIDGGQVKWSFLWDLHHLQEKIGMNFANKLSKLHLDIRNQVIKVYFRRKFLAHQ